MTQAWRLLAALLERPDGVRYMDRFIRPLLAIAVLDFLVSLLDFMSS